MMSTQQEAGSRSDFDFETERVQKNAKSSAFESFFQQKRANRQTAGLPPQCGNLFN